MAMKLAAVFFSMIFVDNYVLSKFLGICPFLGVSKKLNSAVGMSVAVTVVMVLATAATWPIYYGVQLLEILLKRFFRALYTALGVYLPLITTNCAILGVTILNIDNGYTFAEALVCATGAGIGFLLAMVLFSGVRSRLEDAEPPRAFEGLPITLVAASLVSLSFMGFGGMIEAIFGA